MTIDDGYVEKLCNAVAEAILTAFEGISIEDVNMYQLGYEKGRNDAIEFISDKLIYPLLDEYDRGLWEHINYIELAEEWIKVLDDNPYPKVENHTEARKRDLRQWIADQMKEGAEY